MLTLTTLALDLLFGRSHRATAPVVAAPVVAAQESPRARSRRTAKVAEALAPTPLLCFEVLVPYVDPTEARKKKVPLDTRLSMTVRVWSVDATGAAACASERFADLRLRRRGTPRLAEGGPVVLRIVEAAPGARRAA